MTSPTIRIWTAALPLVFLGISSNAYGQSLFNSHEIFEVQIEAPLSTFSRERSDVDYLDGTFSYTDELGESRSFDLKLRARGRYRRQKKTCSFPPIRLNFKTGQVEGTVLDGEDKLKLVTHCRSRGDRNEQLVLREYMTYRILQILTDKNFRARLLRITYINSERDGESMTKYGFVIEDDDSVGERLGLTVLDRRSLKYEELDAKQTNLVNLFQYLIGNTDYSMIRGPADDTCCHNSVPFSDGNTISPIPYDFDFSGLVNAPYAEPNPELPIRSVRTRLYRGRCNNSEHLSASIAQIQSHQAEIFALVDEIVGFNRTSRQSVTKYLNGFFKEISNEKTIEKRFVKKCS